MAENKPLLGIHRVTLEQGEDCFFCKKRQATYISFEQALPLIPTPVRIVSCLPCGYNLLKRQFPVQLTKLQFILDKSSEVKLILQEVLSAVSNNRTPEKAP